MTNCVKCDERLKSRNGNNGSSPVILQLILFPHEEQENFKLLTQTDLKQIRLKVCSPALFQKFHYMSHLSPLTSPVISAPLFPFFLFPLSVKFSAPC